MANNFHLRRLCRGAILATALPCSILHPTSAFPKTPVHCRSKQARIGRPALVLAPSVAFPRRRVPPSSASLRMASSTVRENKSYIDKLALILVNSKREQLVARSTGREVFYTPGGKREAGESDEEALVRECREELSVDLSASNVEKYGSFEAQAYGKPEGTMVRITCFRVLPREAELEFERLVKASEEVEELKWIDSSFDRERLTVTGIMILDDLKEKGFIR